jgi:glycosyltransferase involved in cell wall biosynthesis
MKVLIETYNSAFQNPAGGISIRINNFIRNYRKYFSSDYIKLFDKWNDKLKDFDLLHIFKVNIEDFQLMNLAKSSGLPVIISSVVPMEKVINIAYNKIIYNLFKVHTGYWFLGKMLSEANAIICQTHSEAVFIKKYYGAKENRIEIIPNGLSIEFSESYRGLIKNRIGVKGDYVLQVGRFDRNKNQLAVIRAMADTDIPIIFIGGEDNYEPEYYEICRRHATSNMFFLGWISNDDPLLASAYMNARVIVFPSKNEIFGNALIEGAAAGANLVVSKNVPVKDLGIEEFCEFINPNDINDIRRKIKMAYSKEKNIRLSNKVKKMYSWENIVNKYNSTYKKAINGKNVI